ncbi:MAG: LysM peptidoglycan-binding domain-containing protein [Pseudomonadota bacterium]|nr:MAG: LysM peptidoglycan-binding domain-containing protein [Pseudomonadota bacterium]
MDWKNSQQAILSVSLGLTLVGCATTPSTSVSGKSIPEQATAPAVATVSSEPIPAPTSSPDPAPAVDAAATETVPTTLELIAATPQEYPDIWARIRAGFAMKPLEGHLVQVHERWVVNNPDYLARMMDRSRLYLHFIVEEIEKRGLPTELALLPAIESAYQPLAHSRARAVGLWQFIAPTGRTYGLKMNWWYDGRRDVMESTRAALDYLEKLYNEFDGDWHLALAAYNAGENKIHRMQAYNRGRGKPTDYQSLKLKAETINYVPKLQAMVNIVATPDRFGVKLANIPDEPYFARVQTDGQIDLGVVAKLAETPIHELYSINPGYQRFATDPDGPHTLLVPVDKKDTLLNGLSTLAKEDRVQYRHHLVRRGDTLHEISRRYGVTVEAIRTANHLSSNLLRAGQDLIIPVSARPIAPAVLAATPRPTAVAARSGPQPVVHHVRSGDTLSSIARRYGVLVRQLTEWNLIEADDILRLGQRIKVWPGSAS